MEVCLGCLGGQHMVCALYDPFRRPEVTCQCACEPVEPVWTSAPAYVAERYPG